MLQPFGVGAGGIIVINKFASYFKRYRRRNRVHDPMLQQNRKTNILYSSRVCRFQGTEYLCVLVQCYQCIQRTYGGITSFSQRCRYLLFKLIGYMRINQHIHAGVDNSEGFQ